VASAALVEQMIREISDAIAAGESVKLSGFGVFTVRQQSRRVSRNWDLLVIPSLCFAGTVPNALP
jgi:nucleoid DNA-binding protein